MSLDSKKVEPPTEIIKLKRGRKSKKELMAALNIQTCITGTGTDNKNSNQNLINLNVFEIDNNSNNSINNLTGLENNLCEEVLKYENFNLEQCNPCNNEIITHLNSSEEPKISKKRGRKPKGGKIIQQIVISNDTQTDDKPNVILHLKCSMKDLQTATQDNNIVESYNFLSGKNDSNYEFINNENNINMSNDKTTTSLSKLDTCIDYDESTYIVDDNGYRHVTLIIRLFIFQNIL